MIRTGLPLFLGPFLVRKVRYEGAENRRIGSLCSGFSGDLAHSTRATGTLYTLFIDAGSRTR
jgi:hypothetical protein